MSSPVVTVAPETRLYDARRIMNAERIRTLPVVKNGALVGIITRRGLLRADVSPLQDEKWNAQININEETIGAIMTANPITTSPDTLLPKAARVMMENKITALPVLDERRKLVGILTTSDLFRAIIAEAPYLSVMPLVKAYMAENVVSISPETSLLEAHRLMGIERIRALPVLEKNRLVGIVTRTDLMSADSSRFLGSEKKELALHIQTQDASRFMTPNPIAVTVETTVVEAARLLLENKFHALPVRNADGDLVGILTETDLFRMMIQKFLSSRDMYVTNHKETVSAH
jgi:CBS domain-containing protein